MADQLAEPFIPRQLDRDFALAVRAALTLPDPTTADLRHLVTAIVATLREQGASVEQVLDAMEDAVAAVLAARVSGGHNTHDPNARNPAAILADHARLLTSEVLLDHGLQTPKSRIPLSVS